MTFAIRKKRTDEDSAEEDFVISFTLTTTLLLMFAGSIMWYVTNLIEAEATIWPFFCIILSGFLAIISASETAKTLIACMIPKK